MIKTNTRTSVLWWHVLLQETELWVSNSYLTRLHWLEKLRENILLHLFFNWSFSEENHHWSEENHRHQGNTAKCSHWRSNQSRQFQTQPSDLARGAGSVWRSVVLNKSWGTRCVFSIWLHTPLWRVNQIPHCENTRVICKMQLNLLNMQ